VKKYYSSLFLLSVVFISLIIAAGCRKINQATDVGGDLIPAVDNITTFDTTITVEAYNDSFGLANDSQFLSRGEEMFLGKINNDPFFGKTDAQMFFELKPSLYGTYPFARKDSVKIDSIVLVLSYLETYGDTNTAQSIKVYELDQGNNFTSDSAYLIRKENFTYNTAAPLSLPGQLFVPRNLNDSVKAFRDTTVNQLRIKLDTNFARRLFNYDTSNAYKTDSIFRARFKGFALRSEGTGNAIMGFSLADINTKLAVYYNYPKPAGAGRDTTVNYFFFTSLSAAANYIGRDYNGTPFAASVGGATPDPFVYLQNSPGTFATLKIPGLLNVSNRLIHRAELIAEQVYDISDSTFFPPQLLYLDAFDPAITATKKYRAIPLDVQFSLPNFGSPINLSSFGVSPTFIVDGSGNRVRTWKFNISRYVQNVLTQKRPLYDLRLFAPFIVSNRYENGGTEAESASIFGVNPTIAKGRIRLGGGNHPTQKMRLRLVYSKL
jgi:hypothetical protein